MVAQTVKKFVFNAYKLISASSPTVPLQGSDQLDAVEYLNDLMSYYSGTGMLLTIAKEVSTQLEIGQQDVTFGDESNDPEPDVVIGRLANLQNAWLLLDGLTYPLYDESRNEFFAAYKYDPQQGLPRYVIVNNETDLTRMRIYPAPSQPYQLFVYGKFELKTIGINDDMSSLPRYYKRYLRFALAKDLAFYKGRSEAWTQKLEDTLKTAKEEMEAVSPINLNIEVTDDSLLNGSWRVRAGI